MANLIITVISIALVAIAALMGAYYGGRAFMDGQARAQANTFLSQAGQLSGALNLYLSDGNDQSSLAWNSSTGVTNLTPKYLATDLPRPSTDLASSNLYWLLVSDTNWTGGSQTATGNAIGLRLNSSSMSKNICLIITQMANGSSATIQNNLSSLNGKKFDCGWVTSSSFYIIVYRFR